MALSTLAAALVIAVVGNVGDDTNYYEPQTWYAPDAAELVSCARMAHDLNEQFEFMASKGLNVEWQSKFASCEVRLTRE